MWCPWPSFDMWCDVTWQACRVNPVQVHSCFALRHTGNSLRWSSPPLLEKRLLVPDIQVSLSVLVHLGNTHRLHGDDVDAAPSKSKSVIKKKKKRRRKKSKVQRSRWGHACCCHHHRVGGAGRQATGGWGRGYLSPALDVIHSRPWHKLEQQRIRVSTHFTDGWMFTGCFRGLHSWLVVSSGCTTYSQYSFWWVNKV